MRRQQGGYALLSTILALVVIGAALPSLLAYYQEVQVRREAEAAGLEAARLTSAVRSYLSEQTTNAFSALPPLPTPNQRAASYVRYDGTRWLKGQDCVGGLASKPFLPCSAGETIDGKSVATYIFNRVSGSTVVPTATIYVDEFTDYDGTVRLDLTSRAADAANGAQPVVSATTVTGAGGVVATSASPVVGMFYGFYPFAADSAWSYPTPTPTVGSLIAEVSGAPELDSWLRTDGSNQMHAALNMGGNRIKNLAGIDGDFDVAGNVDVSGVVQANDFFLKDIDPFQTGADPKRGTYISSGLQFPIAVTDGSLVNVPTCPLTSPIADITWTPVKVALVDDNAVLDISAWSMIVEPPSGSPETWKVTFQVFSRDSDEGAFELTPDRGQSRGFAYVRCHA